MKIRKPAVAGMFYNIDPVQLDKQLSEFMLSAKTKSSCIGVISPHAGYVYSGRTAAFAINSLKPAKTIIILGPNHTGLGSQFSLMSEGVWKTPLGDARIDDQLAAEFMRRTDIADDPRSHTGEHSIEVQLPFLQKRLKDFSFVPICIMNMDYSDEFMEACVSTGEIIADIITENEKKGKSIGIVASSDFSHYVAPATINDREKQIVKSILEIDVAKFFDALSSGTGRFAAEAASVCGFGPIAVLMAASRKLGLKARSIDASNSGGESAVSYRAIGFER